MGNKKESKRNKMSETPVSRPISLGNNRKKRYESLVDKFYQDVFRYAYWLTRNPTVAEDLVQETFLRAWRSFDSLQSDDAAKAWLFTILRRENARMYERYRPELVDIDDVSIQEDDRNEPDQRQKLSELHYAILQLEKEYRDPLMLQVVGGFSGKEIAEILDLNNNTVMTRLFRARSKLRDIMDPGAASDEETGDDAHEELC
ncbi:sigma-70 family RNA polymerase sigma factor [Gammaproteobacteria bacterium LSUCC0112]|nr:sigma-70 family RNA polymerase sigma factor [Gammaproteobacteria bacterium LSUCC0112]